MLNAIVLLSILVVILVLATLRLLRQRDRLGFERDALVERMAVQERDRR